MEIESLYTHLKNSLESNIDLLLDKPEETVDSTLQALWLAASGNPVSAFKASEHQLTALTTDQLTSLHQMVDMRLKHIPLAHITGRQNFIGIDLLSDKRALIPRKETELLGMKALEISYLFAKSKDTVRVMDICCGSGNLGLVLAYYNQKNIVFATDLSQEAVDLTVDNIDFLKLQSRMTVLPGDMFTAYDNDLYYDSIDLIICNPPYISTPKVSKMNSEISNHEPMIAFDGGKFGIDLIHKLLIEAPKYLAKGGWLIFEIGLGQGDFIMRLCTTSKLYVELEPVYDAFGNLRVILARKE